MDKNEEAYAICKFFAAKCGLKRTSMFIAGSWVANPFRANDIDIWVYRPECIIKDEEYRDLGNLIHGATHYERSLCYGDDEPDSFLEWYGTPVQIIETPYPIFELMNMFDLSCCCYALTYNGVHLIGDKATHPVDEEIEVLKTTLPTPHRLRKLNKRYGHTATLVAGFDSTNLELEVPF